MNKCLVLVDERISERCFNTLCDEGYTPIRLPKIPSLPSAIASHTDILAFKLKSTLFFSKHYFNKNFDILSPLDIKNVCLTDSVQGVNYPLDAVFNGLVIDGKLFCKADTFATEILSMAESVGVKIVPVKQGYPACTVLKISENAAITADEGMAKALEKEGISVLRIKNGSISLPPYEYGFIGGAGEMHGSKVYFFGEIHTHPEADRIVSFIEETGKTAISLSDGKLCDLGGMIFL